MAIPKALRSFGLLVKSRKIPVFSWTWALIVGCLVATGGFPPLFPFTVIILSRILASISVYIYNDFNDMEFDKDNHAKGNRPLPSGKVSRREASIIILLSGFVSAGLSLLVNIETFILSLVWQLLFVVYSQPGVRLKEKFLVKEGSIAANFMITSLIAGVSMGSLTPAVLFTGVFISTFALMCMPAITDTSDIEEDKKAGVKTLAMVLSWRTKISMIVAYILIFMTLTPLTYVYLGFNFILPIIVVAMSLIVLRNVIPLAKKIETIAYDSGKHKGFKPTFAYFFITELAMVIGSLGIL